MSNIEILSKSSVRLYKSNASDIDVARAAWVSHSPDADQREVEDGRIEGLINFLWKNGHHSPFEHGQFTFVVETPIFVAREFMRHRSFSFNETSGRYSTLKSRFYVPGPGRPLVQTGKTGAYTFTPGEVHQDIAVYDHLGEASQQAWDRYEDMLDQGIAREVARMVLPINTMTTFWATVNPRNLMHFLDLRLDDQAQVEIRDVANQMADIFEREMPITYQAWLNN